MLIARQKTAKRWTKPVTIAEVTPYLVYGTKNNNGNEVIIVSEDEEETKYYLEMTKGEAVELARRLNALLAANA